MIFWTDYGLIVRVQNMDERKYIVDILSKQNGKWRGVYRGKWTPMLGTYVYAEWKARLPEHIGSWKIETTHASVGISLWNNSLHLMTLLTICELCKMIPERQQCDLYDLFVNCLSNIEKNAIKVWIEWENAIRKTFMHQESKNLQEIMKDIYFGKCEFRPQLIQMIYKKNLYRNS